MSNEIRVPTMKLNQQWAGNSWFPSAVYSVTPTTLLLSLSHPRLLRRQSSRIESKIQKLGRRVGHTLFGVNESCPASESEQPPPSTTQIWPRGHIGTATVTQFSLFTLAVGKGTRLPHPKRGPTYFPEGLHLRVFVSLRREGATVYLKIIHRPSRRYWAVESEFGSLLTS